MVFLGESDDGAADGEDAGGEVQVADPYLGQLAVHPVAQRSLVDPELPGNRAWSRARNSMRSKPGCCRASDTPGIRTVTISLGSI